MAVRRKTPPQKHNTDPSPQPFERAPIYVTARKLLGNTQTIIAQMPQKQKYVTGKEIATSCAKLMENICFAYMEQDIKRKISFLRIVQRKVACSLVWYRIANDLNLLSRDMYIAQVEMLVSIVKQSKGWLDKVQEQSIGE